MGSFLIEGENMDKQKLKRTLIREGIILGAILLISWIFYNVGNIIENKVYSKNIRLGHNITLTCKTTGLEPWQESSCTGRIAGREGFIDKSGKNLFYLDDFMSGEGDKYTDKEKENIVESIIAQEQKFHEQKNISSTLHVISRLIFIFGLIIYLLARAMLWIVSSRRESDIKLFIVKSKKILHIAMGKDFLIRTALILGIIFLSVSILKSCGFMGHSG